MASNVDLLSFQNQLGDYYSQYQLQQAAAIAEQQHKAQKDESTSTILFDTEMIGSPILDRILSSKSFKDSMSMFSDLADDPTTLIGSVKNWFVDRSTDVLKKYGYEPNGDGPSFIDGLKASGVLPQDFNITDLATSKGRAKIAKAIKDNAENRANLARQQVETRVRGVQEQVESRVRGVQSQIEDLQTRAQGLRSQLETQVGEARQQIQGQIDDLQAKSQELQSRAQELQTQADQRVAEARSQIETRTQQLETQAEQRITQARETIADTTNRAQSIGELALQRAQQEGEIQLQKAQQIGTQFQQTGEEALTRESIQPSFRGFSGDVDSLSGDLADESRSLTFLRSEGTSPSSLLGRLFGRQQEPALMSREPIVQMSAISASDFTNEAPVYTARFTPGTPQAIREAGEVDADRAARLADLRARFNPDPFSAGPSILEQEGGITPSFFTRAKSALGDWFDRNIKPSTQKIQQGFQQANEDLTRVAKSTISDFKTGQPAEALTAEAEVLPTTSENIATTARSLLPELSDEVSGAVSSVGEMGGLIGLQIGEGFIPNPEIRTDVQTTTTSGIAIHQLYPGASEQIQQQARALFQGAQDLQSTATQAASDLQNTAQQASSTMTSVAQDVSSTAQEAVVGFQNQVSQIQDTVSSGISDAAQGASDAAASIGTSIGEAASSAAEAATDAAAGALSAIPGVGEIFALAMLGSAIYEGVKGGDEDEPTPPPTSMPVFQSGI